MNRRPRSKPRPGHSRSPKSAYGRRTPPPERTGLEAAYLSSIVASKERLTILLRSGETVSGLVESFDRDVITILPAEGPAVTLRKDDIRYLGE